MEKFKYFQLFSFSGVPVYMHWSMSTALLLLAVIGFFEISLLIVAFSFFTIMLIHELGHMWVASKLGLKSYNINLFLLHGKIYYERADTEYHNALVAWGGVLAQAIVFVPCLVVFTLYGSVFPWYLNTALLMFGYFNAIIAVCNLIPTKGLDGMTCWKAIPLYFKYDRPRFGRKKRKPQLKSIK